VPYDGDIWTSPTIPWDQCSLERRAALRVCWGAGELRFKLDPNQQGIYDSIRASHATTDASINRYYCLDMARQVGKDFLMGVLALETCLRNRKRCRVVYAAPTRDEVKELLVPTLEAILEDCPPELLPREVAKGTFVKSANGLTFAWGARVVLIGVDLHPNRLRGPATLAFLFTECAFVSNITDLMSGVLLPQMLTQPSGFGVMGSTPPVTPAHPWTGYYIPRAKSRGMYSRSIITDCPRFTSAQVRTIMQEHAAPDPIAARVTSFDRSWDAETKRGFVDGIVDELKQAGATMAARELFCEHVIETTLTVIPEMQRMKPRIVISHYSRPQYCDTYTVIDPGFAHATGALFLYVDFAESKIVVEGDFARRGQNTREIARLIYAREWQLWGYAPRKPECMTDDAWSIEIEMVKGLFYPGLPPPPERPVGSFRGDRLGVVHAPYARITDIELRLIADLSREHGLAFRAAEKDGVDTSVNRFRLAVQGSGDGAAWKPRIEIHERCTTAIEHWEHALWNKQRTKLAEAPDGTHYDCLPAGIYAVRGVDWAHNPVPPPRVETRIDTTWDVYRADNALSAKDRAFVTKWNRR